MHNYKSKILHLTINKANVSASVVLVDHSNANQESDLFRNQFGPLAQVAVGLGEMFWVIKGKWCL